MAVEDALVKTGKPWRRGALVRDPGEGHRAATPLELFFDLCFVVAVSQLTAALEHDYALGHIADGVIGFLMLMFAIWWAWMGFVWFATAHDSDDVPYRLLTLLQIAGVLILASGVGKAFDGETYRVVVAGYVVMRVALITQWMRVARQQPSVRGRALRYGLGMAVVQVLWVLSVIPDSETFFKAVFVPLILAEIAVPIIAERSDSPGQWHIGHVSERYGLLTLIILGESVLAATVAVKDATEFGVTASIVTVAAGGLLIAFACWWLYFDTLGADSPDTSVRTFVWGYGHYVVFGALAAVGGGLATAAAQVAGHGGEHAIAERTAALAVTVPLALFLVAVAAMSVRPNDPCGPDRLRKWTAAGVVVVLAGVFLPPAPATAVAGVVVSLLVAIEVVTAHRRYVSSGGGPAIAS
ncbi:low temperature requirement protein A [Yinghuangia sp. ASG 101]|uniref:low temperature requirement protein A n=1 Tax=Yinghuangia sp. ASG 101 TaxID=2896848 RepID=UPI001E46F6AE|nr:low temperature requirement protein A [Yinghuangia sp. ASG 101]UGQ13257.1 low temperature requirement protein A [Yinghuangia sp. ASG 101]